MKKHLYSHDELAEIFKKALREQQIENYSTADSLYSLILNQLPKHADSLHYQGLIKHRQGMDEQAIILINKALLESPSNVDMQINLATILQKNKQYSDAIDINFKILLSHPNYAMAHHNLSQLYKINKDRDKEEEHCLKAYKISPQLNPIISDYARLLWGKSELIKAIDVLKTANISPSYDSAILTNLVTYLFSIGDYKGAKYYSNKMTNIVLDKDHNEKHSPEEQARDHIKTLLQSINSPLLNSKEEFDVHVKLSNSYPKFKLKKNVFSNKKKRIGYISADFHFHSVMFFLRPILENHNTGKFDVYCYSNTEKCDHLTNEIKTYAHSWQDITSMSDIEVIKKIQEDRIDVLIDLSGYTYGNRLGIFANQTAAIQITYLGSPNSTGLSTMNYRLTDNYADPIGLTEHIHSEKLIRLSSIFLCYSPVKNCPKITVLPACKNNYITFGSFNNMSKINDSVVSLWVAVLKAVPKSKLLLKSKVLSDHGVKEFTLNRFKKMGINHDRIELLSYSTSYKSHMEMYSKMDISLDTFPYSGTTTSCESLWMGVPVITLCGDSHISRVSSSILSKIKLKELIANDEDEFIKIACELASKIKKLSSMRQCMRDRITKSGFIDGEAFTQELENIYISLWNLKKETDNNNLP